MDEDRCWKAVLARDAGWDGRFVYAVRSTGVYCRPSCPSRRPRRNQVRLFALPELAEKAGFRSCRRCRPRDAACEPNLERVREAIRLIDARPESPPTLTELGAQAGVTPSHFQRAFKQAVGITPRQYADALRLGRFRALLREGGDLTDAMYAAGYGSSSRLYERANDLLGMTPATYRRGGAGAEIAYAVARSPIGRLLVAATAKGVCAVRIGDSDEALEADLRREFFAAEIRRDEKRLKGPIEAVLRHLKGSGPQEAELPLDVRATAFQRRVWTHLRTIPAGETRTYTEVAEAIGRPKAARAVSRAVATNGVALIVPCHRVVRADGGLAGYRWGVERKRVLLERERRRKK